MTLNVKVSNKFKNNSGFMLLEAIVSMIIFTFIATALFSVLNSTSQGSEIIPQKSCALWVAQNQIALVLINKVPRKQIISSGREHLCDRQWEWKITTQDTPDPRLWQIKVMVFNQQRVEIIQYAFMPK